MNRGMGHRCRESMIWNTQVCWDRGRAYSESMVCDTDISQSMGRTTWLDHGMVHLD